MTDKEKQAVLDRFDTWQAAGTLGNPVLDDMRCDMWQLIESRYKYTKSLVKGFVVGYLTARQEGGAL
jgi:hypothetical protein